MTLIERASNRIGRRLAETAASLQAGKRNKRETSGRVMRANSKRNEGMRAWIVCITLHYCIKRLAARIVQARRERAVQKAGAMRMNAK
ncbi:unnamed protein product [Toxocara canis]|uniref:Uncharacterized protein n=1 Tax=Toxocara canis TaxID=6265 RepID=A0A183UTL3_TOXCA|nr:unnamed protein product [Toxocara canis]